MVEFATCAGHIAYFLYNLGLNNLPAIDIAGKAVKLAYKKYPYIYFKTEDMLDSGLEDDPVDRILCFYSIVHFTYKEIDAAIKEWKRILKKECRALFSFNVVDDESLRVVSFLGNDSAKAARNSFSPDKIIKILKNNGIAYEEAIVRYPYPGKEHPIKRSYIIFYK